MKIEIRNGRLVDPKHGIDAVTTLYIAAGRVAAIGAAPARWHRQPDDRRRGPRRLPGPHRPRRRGCASRGSNTWPRWSRRWPPRSPAASPASPARPTPIRRWTSPGLVQMLKHRARSLNQAHVYPGRRADRRPEGRGADRDGRARRSGLRRVLARRGAARPTPRCSTGRCSTRRPSATASGCGRRTRTSAATASRTTARSATRLGLAAIPSSAETIALATIFALVRETGVRVHLCRLSTADGVAMVRAARKEGLPVTCDVAIHHLHLCDVDIGWFDAQCHLVPPLRGTRDRAALRAGLADGTIDLACSDHTPVDDDCKQVPFGEVRARGDRPRTAAAADAQVGGRGEGRPRRGAGADHRRAGGDPRAGRRTPRRRAAGGRLRLRSGRALGGRAEGAEEPGPEHPVPRAGSSRPRALYARRRAGRLRSPGG